MTAPDPRPSSDLALRLTMDTFITLYWRRHLLDETTGQLRDLDHHVVELDAARWTTLAAMHRDIAAALDFPGYYGHNLDALNDCLGDVACDGGYTDTPHRAGLVLSLTNYDHFTTIEPESAQIVLDIIAGQARRATVLGRRMICLVHSNDPDIRFEPVGATPVMWNHAEWLDSNRQ
ncbi:barstar family protein [Streptomyces sp. NPDC048434]|uniref:barstar family protein n=1 Tax=Streptomyces sp. NPDC048434 TaxID=3365549 RepID=UPI003716E2F3